MIELAIFSTTRKEGIDLINFTKLMWVYNYIFVSAELYICTKRMYETKFSKTTKPFRVYGANSDKIPSLQKHTFYNIIFPHNASLLYESTRN